MKTHTIKTYAMKTYRMRKAFSMLTAIFLILIMASIAAFVMGLSGKVSKSTFAQYRSVQAELYAKSYTEFAVMAIQANDRATKCVETINGRIGATLNNGGYTVRTEIAYIGTPTNIFPGTCPGTRQITGAIATTSTPLSAIIDVYVTYKNTYTTDGLTVTVHRRSIQKI